MSRMSSGGFPSNQARPALRAHASKIFGSLLLVVFFGAFFSLSVIPSFSRQQTAGGQKPQSQPSAPQPLRVTSRLVQVTVTVQDEDGHPVTGLTKDDFKIFDQGKPQQIAAFSAQTSHITANASAPASPNFFSNRTELPADSQPPLTVIVMDAFEAKYQDYFWCSPPQGRSPVGQICQLGWMSEQVGRFISQIKPEDRVALYEIGMQLYLLQDFTNDANALRRGLDLGNEYARQIRFPWSVCQPLSTQHHTLDALHEIADRLARVPGRKNLIVLSHGFPPIPLNDGGTAITNGNIDNSVKTLGNSDLPMTAIDTAGVYVGGIGGGGGDPIPAAARRGPVSGSAGGPSGAGRASALDPLPGCPWPHLTDFDYSRTLADRTGGHAVLNTNDIASAMRRVMDDYSVSYLLAYYPDHNKWNGEFRDIKVKVDRPGVDVHARNGYFAVADPGSAAQLAARRLADAVSSPLDATDIAFDVHADAVDVPGARQLKLKVTLDANQLRFQQQGAHWTDSITHVWAQFDAEGHHSIVAILRASARATCGETIDIFLRFFLRRAKTTWGAACFMSTPRIALLTGTFLKLNCSRSCRRNSSSGSNCRSAS
jgi:VWFA-related protein